MPNLESLRALLKLQSPQHITQDPYMAGRRPDIMSGMDDMLPGADSAEYRGAQLTPGAGTINVPGRTGKTRGVIQGRGSAVTGEFEEPGMSHTFSREDMRGSDMSKLRQVLGLGQREHEQVLEQNTLKGEYDVAGHLVEQNAAMQREMMTQQAIGRRSDADRTSRDAASRERLQSMEGRQTAGDNAAMARTQTTQKGLDTRAQARNGAGWDSLYNRLFGGGDETTASPEQPIQTQEDFTSSDEFDFDPRTGQLIPRR